MAKDLPDSERLAIEAMIARARAAMREVTDYDQARIDRLVQALGWATANEKTFGRIVAMSVKESGLGREGPRYAMQEMTEERLITLSLA